MKENLILLHGALGSKTQLEPLKELLSSAFDVYTLNFSGHGGDLIEGPFTIDLFVRNIIEFMDTHHILSAHLFGYSMGGYVALQLAHQFPGRARKIITLGTKFHWDPASAAKEVRMMNPEVIEHKIPAFADTLAKRHAPAAWKSIMILTAEMMTELGAGKAMTAADFATIENEVLICIGTDDHMVTIEESENTASQLKKGHLKIIEGFRHPLEAIDIDQLAVIILESLQSGNQS
ncbi:MAG: alpha/beta hydrolase [Saprospiraceae bacterium]|nr:alpha/beta hydrolase [Saprospiraceae bacterium]